MKLSIPPSPVIDDNSEIFLTPNCSTLHESNFESPLSGGDSGVEEFSTPIGGLPVLPPFSDEINYRVKKNQSTGNIPNNKCLSLSDTDPSDSGLDERFSTPNQSFDLYRMRSMGNLSAMERAFGDTPKDMLKLKKEFEMKRFGLAKMRSLTNLVAGDEQINNTNDELLRNPLPRERAHDISIDMKTNSSVYSSFSSQRSIRSNGHFYHKKKIGIGDTRWVGGGCEDTDIRHFNLTRMKSLGTIPDIIATEPIHPFLTPNVMRKMSIESNSKKRNASVPEYASLQNYNHNENDENNSDSTQNDSTDGDDEVYENQSHYEFDNNLLRTPFERGFRRSYNAHNHDRNRNNIVSPLRQSDGYFSYAPHHTTGMLTKQNVSSIVTDAKNRSSLKDGFKFQWKTYERYDKNKDNNGFLSLNQILTASVFPFPQNVNEEIVSFHLFQYSFCFY